MTLIQHDGVLIRRGKTGTRRKCEHAGEGPCEDRGGQSSVRDVLELDQPGRRLNPRAPAPASRRLFSALSMSQHLEPSVGSTEL